MTAVRTSERPTKLPVMGVKLPQSGNTGGGVTLWEAGNKSHKIEKSSVGCGCLRQPTQATFFWFGW